MRDIEDEKVNEQKNKFKMKKITLTLITLAFFATSCNQVTRRQAQTTIYQNPTYDAGVVINGIRWATRNVDTPGTFAPTPESAGMFFQWNRRKGWNSVDEEVEGWGNFDHTGTKWYAKNDPCPEGWRVPTYKELRSLQNAGSERSCLNGVHGCFLGTAPNQIFLPATAFRSGDGGILFNDLCGTYWSGTRDSSDTAWFLTFACDFLPLDFGCDVNITADWWKHAFSIRCVAINEKNDRTSASLSVRVVYFP